MGDFVQLEIARIRELVGEKALVIGACSGGVDSTVGAKLMREAIGDRFKAVLIDNGCMRLNECAEVKETLEKHLGINLTVVDAAELFLSRLAGVSEPEKKRKIIGSTCEFQAHLNALMVMLLTAPKSSICLRRRLSGYSHSRTFHITC
jgi:GMP synthase (glutamine-hydrolysing)